MPKKTINLPIQSPKGRPKIGLVLSGGGAKSMAYIGIYEVLIEHKIPIDVITGSSFGAAIGPLIAAGCPPDSMKKIMLKIGENQKNKFSDFTFFQEGLFNMNGFKEPFKKIIKEYQAYEIKDLKIPYGCNAIDLETKQEVEITSGDTLESSMASGALPLIFKPIFFEGKLLIDGGMINNAPTKLARKLGADKIIVFNIRSNGRRQRIAAEIFRRRIFEQNSFFQRIKNKLPSVNPFKKIKQNLSYFMVIAFEIMRISADAITEKNIKEGKSDLVLEPLVSIGSLDFSPETVDKAIAIGRQFALANIDKIKKVVFEE